MRFDSMRLHLGAIMDMHRAGTLGYFGDARRAATGTELIDRAVATGSLVIRKLGVDRAGELAFHRFLSAPSVNCREMLDTLGARSVAACAGRRIVVAQDTTEINFSGREASRYGFGPGGDGVSAGFFLHPLLAIDAESEAVLGLLDTQIWTRGRDIAATPRRARGLDDKESVRWAQGAERAADLLAGVAAAVVVVADRESDIYGSFVRRPAGADIIVRAAHDRAVAEAEHLFASAADWPELARIEVKVAPRRIGDPGRTATVALRAGAVVIKRPRNGFDPADPKTVTLTLVEAREIGTPADGKPLLWRLLTSLAVSGADDAREVVRLYRLRWRIEEVFRALKRDGMALEATQLHGADRLFKLAVVGLGAATRIIQLVDARDGGPRPAADVIDPALLPAARAIGATLERRTARQQNPHSDGSLAWLAWIIARLGGWNCYYKPPGPKTMHAGWAQFATMAAGFAIATTLAETQERNVRIP
jgi:hypothetical protein